VVAFIESRYARELLSHLKEVRGYAVEEKWPGIYIVRGDIIPIQIIDSRKLSTEENLWLRDLNKDLGANEILRITEEAYKQGKGSRIKAYLEAISKANIESLGEAIRMGKTALTLDKVLEDAGFVARWEARGVAIGEAKGIAIGEARGEARGKEKEALAIAQNMINLGLSMETVISG
jgi:hypothetical protein